MTAKKVKGFIIKHKWLIGLVIFYFFIRLINLTLLPIFNDEAIYLDWGWRETHTPGYLYYSLYDGKQPLLMWIFGGFESFLPDPFFAGRFVSILTGFATLCGLYVIAKKYFHEKVGLFAAFFYCIIPLFSFYDRQALMESAVGAVGVWSVYYSLRFFENPVKKYAIFLGVLFGSGFFIKSNSLLFLFSTVLVSCYLLIKGKKRNHLFWNTGIMLGVMVLADFLLLINPEFWQTLPKSSRYVLTTTELLAFPFFHWVQSVAGNAEILSVFLTPMVVLVGVYSIWMILAGKEKERKLLVILFLLPIILASFTARTVSQRYIVSYLPLICIFCGYGLTFLLAKKNYAGIFVTIVVAFLPFAISLIELVSPVAYFTNMARVTRFSDKQSYMTSMTSGYGLDDVMKVLEAQYPGKVVAGIAENSGNPESGLTILALKSKRVQFPYLDASMFGDKLQGVDCLLYNKPLYFVSRNDEQAGLNKYLYKIASIKKPYGNDHIGIYKIKEACHGNALQLFIGAT